MFNLKALILIASVALSPCLVFAQAPPVEHRVGQLQAGAELSFVHLDYSTDNPRGYAGYGTFDFLSHVGLEAEVRSATGRGITETTYSAGPRVLYRFDAFTPYVKALFGGGAFSIKGGAQPGQAATFKVATFGGGLDYALSRHFNVRVFDYEYQRWISFPPRGLQPNAVSFGIAYRFK